jgi:O-antigen/teichoic acid export membrane protein
VIVALRPTATMFVLAQLSVQTVAAVLALCLAPPKLVRLCDRRLIRDALVYALPLIPAMLCTFTLSSADRLIIQADLGPTAVARYQIAYNVGDMPMLLLGVLTTVWMPRIFALEAATERAAVLNASRDALYRLLTPVVIGLSVGSPLVLRLWAPASYRPDDLLFVTALVIVTVIPFTAGLAARRGLLAEGRTATIAAATGVAAITNIILNLILVPRYELMGAAAATFLAYAVLHGLLLLRAGVPRMQPSSSRPLLMVAVAALVALLAAALPTSNSYLVLRGVFVVASVAWFVRILVQITSRRPAQSGRSAIGSADRAGSRAS